MFVLDVTFKNCVDQTPVELGRILLLSPIEMSSFENWIGSQQSIRVRLKKTHTFIGF